MKIQKHILVDWLKKFNYFIREEDKQRAKEEISRLSDDSQTVKEAVILSAMLNNTYELDPVEEKYPAERVFEKLKRMGIE